MQNKPFPIREKKAALDKAARYCAYQERSQQEVRGKLYELGVPGAMVEEVIAELIEQDFINEERFARAYAGGKFRTKGWGRIKISNGLRMKGVSDFCIRSGLKEIDETSYLQKLERILQEKLEKPGTTDNAYALKKRAAAYAVSKGYEPRLVWDVIKECSGP